MNENDIYQEQLQYNENDWNLKNILWSHTTHTTHATHANFSPY